MIRLLAALSICSITLPVLFGDVDSFAAAAGMRPWALYGLLGMGMGIATAVYLLPAFREDPAPLFIESDLADPDGGVRECQVCPFRAEAEQFRHSVPNTDHADQLGGGR